MLLKNYKQFILENYDDDDHDPEWDGIERHEGNENLFATSNGRYDSRGELELKMTDTSEGKLLYQFVDYCKQKIEIDHLNLTSLEGLPKEFAESIKCSDNELTSLVGSPKRIGSMFIAEGNKITTLEGSPIECDEFYCGFNDDLTSLEGSPVRVTGYFDAANNKNLVSLEGNLDEASHIDIRNCTKLTSLKGLPSVIMSDLDIDGCTEIKTLYDIAEIRIDGIIHYENTKITDVEYEYFTDPEYGHFKDTYDDYYKGLMQFITEYSKEDIDKGALKDIHKLYIPDDILSPLDRSNFIKSLKATSKFNL